MGTRGGITGSPQQRDPFAVDQDRALEALRDKWDDAYLIWHQGDAWAARSRDEEARLFTAPAPDDLEQELVADWARGGTL